MRALTPTAILVLCGAWASALSGVQPLPQSPAVRPPNIVLILADDLGIGDVGCYNPNSKIRTPNLDRLAAHGMRFTDAHSPSSVCTPTRYGLLTGRYAWRTRLQQGVLFGLSAPLIAPDRLTVASLLKTRGYRTACVGKWHLGLGWAGGTTDDPQLKGAAADYAQPLSDSPITHGFEQFFGISGSLDMPPYTYIENDRVTALPSLTTREGGRQGPAAPGFHAPDVLPELTRRAVSFISGCAADARSGRPFFLYFPLNAPHTPIVPSGSWKRPNPLGNYACFVEEADDAIGQVLAAIDANGLADQTLVVVTSDNGFAPYVGIVEGDDRGHGAGGVKALEALGHYPSASFRGYKSELWEGGHRVPFLVRWPGTVKPATVCDGLIGLNDFMATAAELTGVRLPDSAGEDSVSFLGLLRGSGTGRESLILHSLNGRFTIRKGDWKLLAWPGSGGYADAAGANAKRLRSQEAQSTFQLYNLRSDPAEKNNLAADHPALVGELLELLKRQVAAGRSTPGSPRTNDVPVAVLKP